MLRIFEDNRIFTTLILLTAMISICGQVIIGIIYQRIIQDTQMHPKEVRGIAKACLNEFSVNYKKYDGVVSITGFVDKYLRNIKIGGLSLRILYNLSGQLLLVSILITGILICRSLLRGDSFFYIVPLYILSMLILYVYYSITSFADVPGKRQTLKTSMCDQLRIYASMLTGEATAEPSRSEKRRQRDYTEQDEPSFEKPRAPRIIKRSDLVSEFSQTDKRTTLGDERELERLLKDFFQA